MIYSTLRNRWLRLLAAIVGEFIAAVSITQFIAPMNLYSGGTMGLRQLGRTLLQDYAGVSFGRMDIAGILYFLLNIPILLLAYKTLGKPLVFKTLICTASYSLIYSLLPIPETPIIDDYLTACLLGGILSGTGYGIVLTCGCSSGGLDIVGLCMSKRGSRFTVGKFSLTFNFFLYSVFLFLFSPAVTIYSVIYDCFSAIMIDKMHQQNVSMQVLIFTRGDKGEISRQIFEKLGRGVTDWKGTGAYTGEDMHILCVCLSKYEEEDLLHIVHSIDAQAFITVQEGARIYGNFLRKLE